MEARSDKEDARARARASRYYCIFSKIINKKSIFLSQLIKLDNFLTKLMFIKFFKSCIFLSC